MKNLKKCERKITVTYLAKKIPFTRHRSCKDVKKFTDFHCVSRKFPEQVKIVLPAFSFTIIPAVEKCLVSHCSG
jgi:hypothetical protein